MTAPPSSRRVLITGSRNWTDQEPIRALIASLPKVESRMCGIALERRSRRARNE